MLLLYIYCNFKKYYFNYFLKDFTNLMIAEIYVNLVRGIAPNVYRNKYKRFSKKCFIVIYFQAHK